MQLCRHLRPLYRRAIKDGNGILRIGTGCGCGWQLCVHFTDPPRRPLRSFRRRTDVQTHPAYPHVVSVHCTKCDMALIFPLPGSVPHRTWPAPWDRPDPRIVCTPDGVFVDGQILAEGQILTIPVTAEHYHR